MRKPLLTQKQMNRFLKAVIATPYYYKIRTKRNKMKHRKTLVVEESWIKLDDWFLGAPPKKNGRNQWHSLGRIWGTCIAHQCPDGSVRAPTSLQIYHRKRKAGGLGIYGKCSACKAPLGRKLKQMIIMMETI